MTTYGIEVQVDAPFQSAVDGQRLAEVVRLVLEREAQPAGTEVTLVVTTDEEIRTLNRLYRDTDAPTDVLAFGLGDGADGVPEVGGGFVRPPELPLNLGDVIISYPRAVAQASELGHGVDRELALLIIHGCLHLLGCDHATEEEERQMWARQDSILREVSS